MSAPSTLHPLIYAYLVSAGLSKTAKALAKEAGDSVTAASSTKLVDVYAQYVKANAAAAPAASGSKRKAEEAEDSKAKKAKKAASSSSSDDEDEAPRAGLGAPKPTPSKKKAASSSSSDDSSSEDEAPAKKPAPKAAIPPPASLTKAAASSSDSDSDSSDDEAPKKSAPIVKQSPKVVPVVKKEVKKEVSSSSSDSSDSDSSDDEDAKPKAVLATPVKVKSENGQSNGSAKASGKKTPNTPFQRVKVGDAPDLPFLMQDNSYSVDRAGGYGALAQSKLGVTRGKGFRHEKTKGKRGNYRGGLLDDGVRSIKFD